uniref:hypothetical protein n=1 Tax=Roseburia sp. TaxID=2049040 RepID=UPI003FEE06CD
MRNIIGAFSALFILVLNLFLCVSVSSASAATSAAKEYKADVIAEIENSNFNPSVIRACISQAQSAGYTLEVTGYVYDADNDIQSAEVIVSYSYEMPLLGISKTQSTRGIAR